jgi:prophage regulatory protein
MSRLLTFPRLEPDKGIPFTRQYLNELIRRGVFPKPVKTPGGGQINMWIEDEIDQYIADMKKARDTAPPDPLAAQRVARMMAARAAKKTTTTVVKRRTRST